MDAWEPDKLLLFLTVFLPGFLSLKVWDLLVPAEQRDFSKSFFDAIAYSTLNFAAFSWLFLPKLTQPQSLLSQSPQGVAILVLVFLIAPMSWPVFVRWLLTSPFLAHFVVSPIKRPWDYVFGKREAYWVIVHLKNGEAVGGKFDRSSFASSYPMEEQVYIEELWELDANLQFVQPIDRSKGAILFKSEIKAIEFFSGE